jgi:tRNA-dihydrouridine synthase B
MEGFTIAGIPLRNRYVQAPLAGFTDFSMRKMGALKGASLVYSEMESCDALVYGSKATFTDLAATLRDKKEEPQTKLALQIFGGKADIVLASIPLCERYADYDFLDFNAGCPVPKVIRQQAGSYWLKREDELIALLSAMVKKSSKPVLLKMRIGFESLMDIVPFAKRAEAAGVKAIAIHGRTRSEGFQGAVHYDVIADVKRNLTIPVIANGEISEKNGKEVLALTKADALMIGQRAIGYPKVFQDLIEEEEGKTITPTTLGGQIADLREHLSLIFSVKDERSASDIMRSISVRYLKGFEDMRRYRMGLVHCQHLNEYLAILDTMQNTQKM